MLEKLPFLSGQCMISKLIGLQYQLNLVHSDSSSCQETQDTVNMSFSFSKIEPAHYLRLCPYSIKIDCNGCEAEASRLLKLLLWLLHLGTTTQAPLDTWQLKSTFLFSTMRTKH